MQHVLCKDKYNITTITHAKLLQGQVQKTPVVMEICKNTNTNMNDKNTNMNRAEASDQVEDPS